MTDRILKVDRTIRELIPPLTAQEYSDLEDSIVKGGCRHPIVVWAGKDIIIDGHNRYDICLKNKVPFKVEEIEFATKREALIWMYNTQLGRRNLTDAARVELALKREQLIGGNISTTRPLSRGARDEIAEAAQVSNRTVSKVKTVLDEGDKKTKKAMREGKVSIDKAYRETRGIEPKDAEAREPSPPTTVTEGFVICPKCHGTGQIPQVSHLNTPEYWQCGECGRKVYSGMDNLDKCPGCGVVIEAEKVKP